MLYFGVEFDWIQIRREESVGWLVGLLFFSPARHVSLSVFASWTGLFRNGTLLVRYAHRIGHDWCWFMACHGLLSISVKREGKRSCLLGYSLRSWGLRGMSYLFRNFATVITLDLHENFAPVTTRDHAVQCSACVKSAPVYTHRSVRADQGWYTFQRLAIGGMCSICTGLPD